MTKETPVFLSTASTETFEPYVAVEKAARYLDMKPKTLLQREHCLCEL
jgi:hypothetical protein